MAAEDFELPSIATVMSYGRNRTMQLKVAKILNSILVIITIVILVLAAGYIVVYNYAPNFKLVYLILFVIVAVVLMGGFRWLEKNWDKRVITKMTQEGKIALASITGGSRVMKMRDATFTNYWLYEFTGTLHTPEGKQFSCKFYEKMSWDTDTIPQGNVYVTYDEEKPSQIFVIPNVLISHIPALAPIIQKFESNRQIKIKYLDAHYNRGMVIRTFQEAIAEQKHRENQKKLAKQQANNQ